MSDQQQPATILENDPRLGQHASIRATGKTGPITLILRSPDGTELFTIQDGATEHGTQRADTLLFHPHTKSFSLEESAMLLGFFQVFRANENEAGDDYSNRDELEQKLKYGGYLTRVDVSLLRISIIRYPFLLHKTIQHFFTLVGEV
jgi:hypothetical protein